MTEPLASTNSDSRDRGTDAVPFRARKFVFWLATLVTASSLALALGLEIALSGWSLLLGLGFALLAGVCGLGLLLVRRVPHNKVSWILLIAALTSVNNQTAYSYFEAGYALSSVAFITHHVLLGVSFVASAYLVLTFPTGHAISRSWQWVGGVAAIGIVLATVRPVYAGLVVPAADLVDGPSGVPIIDAARTIGVSMFGLAMVLALTSFFIRFRRAEGVERLQLRYLIPPFVFLIGFFLIEVLEPETAIAMVFLALGGVSLPVAIVLSILRYRLYEIDRIVSRTVTYAVVIAALTLLVFAVSAAVGTRFTNPTVVAAVTLGITGLFNPLRRRVQQVVDRRFHRSFYDADLVIREFVDGLRGVVDAESVASGWSDVVARTMHPVRGSAWIKSDREGVEGDLGGPFH